MFELMLWISGYASHLRTLALYHRVIGKRAMLPVMMLALVIGWPMLATAAGYNTPSLQRLTLSEQALRSTLLGHFSRWQGVPYRFGGNSRHGVDCSGFVHIMFRDALGMDVPRSTRLLSKAGHRISSRRLAAGDIVLFRTSRNNLHTGIYVGNNQFIHASKSRGVILSSLSNPYWSGVHEKSVRVIDRRL